MKLPILIDRKATPFGNETKVGWRVEFLPMIQNCPSSIFARSALIMLSSLIKHYQLPKKKNKGDQPKTLNILVGRVELIDYYSFFLHYFAQ